MTDKITLTNLVNLTNETTAVNAINTNNAVITAAFDNTLSLDGTSPNSMNANFDMNSNHILNLPTPISANEPLRLQDLTTFNTGGSITLEPIPTGGTTGQVLAKNSSTNYDAGWLSSGTPSGGTSGQVLAKNSSTNYDYSWTTLSQSVFTQINGTTTVTGTNTVYTSSQNKYIVLRSNSGSPMIDTLPGTSPGILPSGTIITIKNNDSSGVLAITFGTGAGVKAQTAATGYIYLGPQQSITFYSDGTDYWAMGQPDMPVLQAATTFYAAATGGSSTNHGLTSSSPIDSITDAYALAQTFNANAQTVTIQAADGTYGVTVLKNKIPGQLNTDVGQATYPVVIQGNTATPTNCVISVTGNIWGAMQVWGDANLLIQGFSLTTASAGSGLWVSRAQVAFKNCNFAACAINHIASSHQARTMIAGNYTINGNAEAHWLANDMGSIYCETTATITLSGSPNFSSAFAAAQYPCVINMDYLPTFSGSASGVRYTAFLNGIINTSGQGSTFFPGNSAGGTSTGGQYT